MMFQAIMSYQVLRRQMFGSSHEMCSFEVTK